MIFTVEEITLITPEKSHGREKLIKNLESSKPYLEDEEMEEIVEELIAKLKAITDEEFARIDFSLALETA